MVSKAHEDHRESRQATMMIPIESRGLIFEAIVKRTPQKGLPFSRKGQG